MRPPTRSTRSVRPSSSKATTNARSSRGGTSDPLHLLASSLETNNTTPPKPTQSIIATASVNKVEPATTFVFESPSHPDSSPFAPGGRRPKAGSPIVLVGNGKPPRSRRRMSSDKLETLDAFFLRNTHPSRKEKEAICKVLDMDIKTITIWFQNKRQTIARSRKQQLELDESEGGDGAMTSTAAMDMLASASATMSPLVATAQATATENPSAATVELRSGPGVARSCFDYSSLDRPPSRLQNASSCDSVPVSQRPLPRIPLSPAVAHDPNVFESVRANVSSSTSIFSPSTDLRKPHLGYSWPVIHPEDLWKHIPSSPAQSALLSSPDVSPDIGTPCRSSRSSVQRPRTLEWACARSAKRRRTNPDTAHDEDEETDECDSVDRPDAYRSSFSISEARVPPECYDKYPLDLIRGAVLLLGLRDARRGLGI
ncbi:hypothetical protein BC827DRAFT_268969 [Russula dissimulans]|nr:hypothetical protein BC827DRAFT_268969 [Russula dissimulans]